MVRRWIGVAGIVLAVAGGTSGAVRAAGQPEFEAEVAMKLELNSVSPERRSEPAWLLAGPEVRSLVHMRLGGTPPLRVTPVTDDTVLLRSRGATPWAADQAAETYAASYVEVRRRLVNADIAAATEQVQRKIDELQSQLGSASEPQRASLVRAMALFNGRLDALLQGDHYAPYVVGFTPAEPVDNGARNAWIVAALGATVGVGAVASARRRRGRSEP